MATAVFTASKSSEYDDLEECWYHFPSTYLAQAKQTVGDSVIFYEPRRSNGPGRSDGAQAYYATARVVNIRPDPNRTDHYFADLCEYTEFDLTIPFKMNGRYFESALRKPDGTTNKGAFGRSIRLIPESELNEIVNIGLSSSLMETEAILAAEATQLGGLVDPIVERDLVRRVVTQRVRDVAFRRHVLDAYTNTCAVTGLHLVDSFGRAEAQAAHIRPVASNGPDSVRNGIAMTASVHWLFDRGIITISNDYTILVAGGYWDSISAISIRRELLLPDIDSQKPHPAYLQWHRERVFLE